jgi:hypothetical protein
MTIISLFVFGWWLVCSERKLLLAAVKPEEQGKYISLSFLSFVFSLFLPILFSISLYFSFSLSYPFNRLFPPSLLCPNQHRTNLIILRTPNDPISCAPDLLVRSSRCWPRRVILYRRLYFGPITRQPPVP